MKVFTIIAKIVVALAAIAGIVYIAATYGDKIVAWCKKLISSCKKSECNIVVDCVVDGDEEVAVEEVVEEEAVAEENDFEK